MKLPKLSRKQWLIGGGVVVVVIAIVVGVVIAIDTNKNKGTAAVADGPGANPNRSCDTESDGTGFCLVNNFSEPYNCQVNLGTRGGLDDFFVGTDVLTRINSQEEADEFTAWAETVIDEGFSLPAIGELPFYPQYALPQTSVTITKEKAAELARILTKWGHNNSLMAIIAYAGPVQVLIVYDMTEEFRNTQHSQLFYYDDDIISSPLPGPDNVGSMVWVSDAFLEVQPRFGTKDLPIACVDWDTI